ncbi:MAG: hypothetical protein JW934_08845 [Anaerolineae bacterium]|nr:hypothetical protein [Anaerolineae bacterium]
MLRKSDVNWLLLEARKHPEAAPQLIEALIERLAELDKENEGLRDQIIRLQHRQTPVQESSSAQVQSLRRQIDVLKGIVDGQATSENALVFISERLQAARTSVGRAQDLARQGQSMLGKHTLLDLAGLLAVRPHDEILMLSSLSRGFKILASDVAPMIDEEHWPTTEGPALKAGERLTVTIAVGEPPRFWTVATARGYAQRFVRVAFDQTIEKAGTLFASPFHNDPPVAILDGSRGDVMLLSRWGEAVRFAQHTIDVAGSVATQLDPDDRFVAAIALPQDAEILILTTSGHAARYDTQKLEAIAKPGAKSRRIFLARDVMSMLPCPPDTHLLYLTYGGKLHLLPTGEIDLLARVGAGQELPQIKRDPILAATLVPSSWL